MQHFQLEPLTQGFLEEGFPLFVKHFNDISANPDIRLNIQGEMYLKAQAAGTLRLFTARTEHGQLIGYAIFFVHYNWRYGDSLQAQEDLLFIDPAHRGFGSAFIDWCDGELRAEGVQVVYRHVKQKAELNYSPLLERKNYKLVDLIWSKRLDKEGI